MRMSPTDVTDTGLRLLTSYDAEVSESSAGAVPSLAEEAYLFDALIIVTHRLPTAPCGAIVCHTTSYRRVALYMNRTVSYTSNRRCLSVCFACDAIFHHTAYT